MENNELTDREKIKGLRMITEMLAEACPGEGFPKLMLTNMDVSELTHRIESASAKNNKLAEKAINIMGQIKNILQDFIVENNIEGGGNN